MGPGTPSAVCSYVGQSESSGHWFTHENPRANPPGVFLCFFTPEPDWSRFPRMELSAWLAREAAQDQADGLPATLVDPTALRLLALGITQARQAPVLPPVARNGSPGH